jgi:dTDP-glucose pyrophosphorylase
MDKQQDLTIELSTTIRHAMQRLDQTAEKCLFVVDENDTLIGTLTDGDVRRAILKGRGLDGTIEGSYNTTPLTIANGAAGSDNERINVDATHLMSEHRVEVVPVVDDAKRILRYVTWTDLFGNGRDAERPALTVPVVIMAGGYGTRLEPFTKVLPKPLIPVHDKPIIEHIIDRFVEVGADEFWLTVNYKSRIMKAYFEDRDPDYTVNFVDEPEPMGTAGSLQFMRGKMDAPFFVTNCDIIINADYRRVMDFHLEQGHAITLVGSAVHYQIPYGTCVLNKGGSLARIDEKPQYDFLVNTGMYVLSPGILDLIPETGVYHMTHLMEAAVAAGHSVGVFPISEHAWIDIGQWKEFQRAAERL